jgi:hypothetical protein
MTRGDGRWYEQGILKKLKNEVLYDLHSACRNSSLSNIEPEKFLYTKLFFQVIPHPQRKHNGRRDMKPVIKAETKCIAVLPMVKHYISEMGIYETLNKHIPKRPNAFMASAQIV